MNGKGTVPVNGNGTVPGLPRGLPHVNGNGTVPGLPHKVYGSAGTEGGAHVGVVGERELAGLRGGDQS